MAFNLTNNLAKISPRTKQMSVIALAVVALIGVLYLSLEGNDKEVETRYNKKTDKQINVLTDSNNKNMGLEALSGRIKYLDRSNNVLSQKIERLEREQKAEKTDETQERLWQEKFDALSAELNALRAQQKDAQKIVSQMKNEGSSGNSNGNASADKGKGQQIDDPFQIREQKRQQLLGDEEANQFQTKNNRPANARRGSGAVKIAMVSEQDETDEDEDFQEQQQEMPAEKAYIPAGTILTGTLITGADFPTGKGSYENPTPSLIRISKHAILPNRYTSDVRECFLLVGGRGDLGSERAKLRGETLSCIRNDGAVIQTKLSSYVAGEDGKEGVKGRLVSKQGQLIARTMVAGFLSGMSEAFDYNQVSVLSTTAENAVQYQKNWSTEAAKGGLATGMQSSLERVADFYMELADQMVPVVEINAGRQVDIIVISGTTLDITAQTKTNIGNN